MYGVGNDMFEARHKSLAARNKQLLSLLNFKLILKTPTKL